MGTLTNRIVRDQDGGDVEIAISGILPAGKEGFGEVILDPNNLGGITGNLKLTHAFFALSGGLEVVLWWEHEAEDDPGDLLLPLEGRGILDIDKVGGLENPRRAGATGSVVLVCTRTSPGTKHFVLTLEFQKQRS